MSLGDAIRGLIDPLHPAVREWLQRELPRLVHEGYVERAQAERIARRYGVEVAVAPPGAGAPSVVEPGEAVPGPRVGETAGEPPTPPGGPAGTAAERGGGGSPGAAGASVRSPAAATVARPAPSPFLADHAVSIVLYLGAFLVVAAVVIFMAYSWGDISGGGKLGVLALLTGGFLGAAWLCLPRPSVRPAGRTFLALGAILVPANVAATYLIYFEESAIPAAVFWLLGAVISGALHAALSQRLASRAYGVLATLAVPVASCALAWLVVPQGAWLGRGWVLGPAAALGLVSTLVGARRSPPTPLVESARVVSSLLLPLAFLVALTFLEERGPGQYAAPFALVLMSGGLALEATRGGRTWWIGAAALLLVAAPVAIALAAVEDRPLFVNAVVVAGLIAVVAARRLPAQQRLLWDVAALVPALLYPLAAWSQDRACLELFSGLALLSVLVARAWGSPLPLYAAVVAVDGSYVKLLDIYGSPDSPPWSLGLALLPLGAGWAVLAALLPRCLSGPAWLGALITLLPALLIAWEQPAWSAVIALTGAAASMVAAWRLGVSPVLGLAVFWLLPAGYQGGEALGLATPWRLVAAGATGWVLLAVSLAPRPTASVLAPSPSPRPAPSDDPPSPASRHGRRRRATAPDGTPQPPHQRGEGAPDSSPQASSRPGAEALGGDAAPVASERGGEHLLPLPALDLDWALVARLCAVATAGVGALALLAGYERGDTWLRAIVVGWLDLALVLAAWATLARSRDLAVLAALSVAPALAAAIGLLHPTDGQAYGLPIGLYLLAVAAVTLRDGRPGRAGAASAIAALGLIVLLGTGIVQSLDRDRFGHALLTLAEGLALVGVGIAVRWRALVIGGVAGTVAIALRQLFDAVAALPGWAILGGSGMLLLGIAVALLLARARLVEAGRSAAERWSSWK